MKLVHYMVRNPARLGELIYPLELDDPSYQGYGSFFVDGLDVDDVRDVYRLYAVRDETLQAIDLRRASRASFEAVVPGIGQFRFKATKVGVPALYGGGQPFPGDSLLVRQLAPNDRRALEQAAQEHKFYFVGYSPKIEDAPDDEVFRSS